MLPQDFSDRMSRMLGKDYPAFLESYDRPRHQSLRINTLKADPTRFLETAPFVLSGVPWTADGFYYDGATAPGKHPYHEAGVYYIQEASAMAPVEYLMREYGAQEGAGAAAWDGERILDLCAAPGGKSTQIAAALRGHGILVCNEIHPARARTLSENIERLGICNAMVTNEKPERLLEHFAGYFTRILVDAPCSGEGMFRKNEEACAEWSLDNVMLCGQRQDGILDCAASMLAPGGILVYSTCTFAPFENEGSIGRFLRRHPEYVIQEVPLSEGMERGVPGWADFESVEGERECSTSVDRLTRTIRLWPHRIKGEGHYLAVLKKDGEPRESQCTADKSWQEVGIARRDLQVPGKGIVEYLEFARANLGQELVRRHESSQSHYLRFGEQLYLLPEGMPPVKGLKVLRPGLHLGTVKKDRFEPSHALALALSPEDVLHTINLDSGGTTIRAYINGETFPAEGEKGWYLITVDGYSTGWGKLAGGIMKNHYPKGLRKCL